ncbi:HTTM domain-containing protein [Polyangium aurulentum]|uniref:HTTM domain-containing protein n=1 Tax=Polyangium aurulentum TaxID=2567896 RepID=UPI0010AE52C7|nr:HTTM domain-containing protein [Polyangium aurulentum]UQA62019.1 HTTM domain-containing protein [Polyangium aurulentum]
MDRSIRDDPLPCAASLFRRARLAVNAFFFTPATARPLAALRVGLAAVLLAQAAALRTELVDYVTRDGLFQGDLGRAFASMTGPHIDDLRRCLSPLGLGEAQVALAAGAVYVAALVLLGLGVFPRIAALFAWFLHWTLMNSAKPLVYGVDQYAHIFLFYLVWVPSGRAWSLGAALRRARPSPTATARLGLRVMQIHMAISYLASGLGKATLFHWWNGEQIWRALLLPDYRQFDMSWLAAWPVLAQLACLATLAIETGYCIFIWPKRTRWLWIAATLGLHLGIATLMGLHFFGAVMCMLTFTLFGVSPEPSRRSSTPAELLPDACRPQR